MLHPANVAHPRAPLATHRLTSHTLCVPRTLPLGRGARSDTDQWLPVMSMRPREGELDPVGIVYSIIIILPLSNDGGKGLGRFDGSDPAAGGARERRVPHRGGTKTRPRTIRTGAKSTWFNCRQGTKVCQLCAVRGTRAAKLLIRAVSGVAVSPGLARQPGALGVRRI
ncbi:hypothetical protein L209DRAFT_294170 [Thermothelomyces heterothallicus CBS 203.75]